MGHRETTFNAFLKCEGLVKGMNILDVGCGGQDCRGMLEAAGFIWHGMDKKDNEQEYVCSMEDMSIIPDNLFDIVFVCHSWEHCERPVDALREFKRVCKPEGIIFISIPMWCEKQVIGMDEDHIMVVPRQNLARLFKYVDLVGITWDELEGENVEISSTVIYAINKKSLEE